MGEILRRMCQPEAREVHSVWWTGAESYTAFFVLIEAPSVSKKLVSYICRASLVHTADVRRGRSDAAEASPLRTWSFV